MKHAFFNNLNLTRVAAEQSLGATGSYVEPSSGHSSHKPEDWTNCRQSCGIEPPTRSIVHSKLIYRPPLHVFFRDIPIDAFLYKAEQLLYSSKTQSNGYLEFHTREASL